MAAAAAAAASAAREAAAAARSTEADAMAVRGTFGLREDVSPIADILATTQSRRLPLSEADMEILEDLRGTPPDPTPHLVQLLHRSDDPIG